MQKETKMESLDSIQDVMQSTDHRTMLKQTRASIFFSANQFTMMYMEVPSVDQGNQTSRNYAMQM